MTAKFNSTYTDDFVGGNGINHRVATRVASTANVNLAANLNGSVIDGIVVAAGDRVLLKNQAAPIDNGIYIIGAGAGTSYRAPDLYTGFSAAFMYVDVQLGVEGTKTGWICISSPATVGVDALSWIQKELFNYASGSFFYATSTSELTTLPAPATTSLLQIDGLGNPSWVNKASIDAGLDPKESCRFGTLTDIGGVYNPAGGVAGTGAFTGVDLTNAAAFDLNANVVAIGNRLLIKNETDPLQNGIYTVLVAGVAGSLERSIDQNGSDPQNVSSGNYTFIELGTGLAQTGWITTGDGILTLNVDPINWVQFNATPTVATRNEILSVWLPVEATTTIFTTVAYLAWSNVRYGISSTRTVFYEVVYVDRTLDIQIYDSTNAVVLGSDLGVATSGFRSFTFTNPGTDARLLIQVLKSAIGGTSPIIYGIQIGLD